MEAKIRAIIKRPDENFRHVTNISPSLKNLQRTVGGFIETVTLKKLPDDSDIVIICNEEGLLLGLPYNCSIAGFDFVGDIICVGANAEEFADCPISFDLWKELVGGEA